MFEESIIKNLLLRSVLITMDTLKLIVPAVRNPCPFLVKGIPTIIAEYALNEYKTETDFYDCDHFVSYKMIRGSWNDFVFVKASTESFIIGNHFSACNHKKCGAYGDTDCDEEPMMVTVTCKRPPTIVNLNQSLRYMELYVDKNEFGTPPVFRCLYKITDDVVEESIKTLRDLGFEGEIPNSDEADDSD